MEPWSLLMDLLAFLSHNSWVSGEGQQMKRLP